MVFAHLLRMLFLLTLFLCSAWSDVSEGIIRNRLIIFGFVFCGIFNCFFPPALSGKALFYAGMVTAVLLLMRKAGFIGGGDIKLLMLLMWVLPDKTGLSVFLLSFPAALLFTIVMRPSGFRRIPFAVCVLLSSAYVFSEEIFQ